jgi:hypothetical protein
LVPSVWFQTDDVHRLDPSPDPIHPRRKKVLPDLTPAAALLTAGRLLGREKLADTARRREAVADPDAPPGAISTDVVTVEAILAYLE